MSKSEKLKFIDRLLNIVDHEIHFVNPKHPKGWSDDYTKGHNSAIRTIKYNLELERKFIKNNVTCGYELALKQK